MKFITSLFLVAAIAASSFAGPLDDLAARKRNDARRSINVLRVASAVVDTETVTIGSVVFEVDTTSVAGITAGRTRLNLSGGSTAAAVGTLTLAENAANTNTVTVADVVYTFQTTLTNVAGNVLIGADASASIDNLIAAINLAAGGGTTYAAATVINPKVTAAVGAGDTMVVTAKIPGAGANAFATTDTLAGSSAWGAATLASGVSPTAGEFTTALETAIDASNTSGQPMGATRISANEILLESFRLNAVTTACTESLAGTNNAWASATMYGGESEPAILRSVQVHQRAANAAEATLQTMHFVFPFTPTAATVQVRTAAGVLVAFDGSVVIGSAGHVDVNGTGSTDVADTDLVVVTVSN